MTRKPPDIDADTVTLAAAGDAAAVEAIVRGLQGPIHAIARRMLLDREDAEDATQESLVRIVTRLAQFRGESKFTTWAFRIAVRRILDFREQRAAAARYSFPAFAEHLADGRDDGAVERVQDAVLHQQIKLACSRAMLHCLDGDHRIAFVLGELLELPAADAGEILGVEPATYRKRLSRARAALTEFLTRTCGVVDARAPCACHRRLERAAALGRVDPGVTHIDGETLVQLRSHIASVSEARRVTDFYRREPEVRSRRDFVADLRRILGTLHRPNPETP
ncbi:RNA polymerase sigma factor [Nannocystis punicea]|uniref:Sigma-70 family RNA polymerase sigma factor n=1 Tax=Nannocystis punicea TaxID=2995304 RepID=A0ABY7GXH0_9BACT|nr:sigma-70 family RNA polymerase sigma factor [Nannocystis poenicansa]WAS91678.1 sigma-70 family RNA polymerase sigma factor [Nannocystis poenicansa]